MPWRQGARHSGFSIAAETWLPVSASHDALAFDHQDGDGASVLNAWRAFLRFRREHRALREGSLALHETQGALIAFERRHEGERLYCAFNLEATPLELAPPPGETLPVLGAAPPTSGGQIHLPGYGALFIRLATV
jgi:alpha-glucosidase